MHTNVDKGESAEGYSFYPIVDGYFKEIKHVIETEIAYTTALSPLFIYKLRRQEKYITQVDGSGDPSFDIFGTGAYSTDATFATTLPNEMMASLLPLSSKAVMTTQVRERINYVVKANDKYIYNVNQRDAFEVTAAAGLFAVFIEIMQVVHPSVFDWLFSRPTGLKFVWMTAVNEDSDDNVSAEFPCAGYLTSIALTTTQRNAGDQPTVHVWTTQDFDQSDDWLFTLDTWFDRGRNTNGITVMPVYNEGTSETAYTFHYQHFGKKRINISDYAMLNYYYETSGTTTFWWYLSADFIPYKNAQWKQIYVNQGFSAVESYNEGFEFAVDLDGAVVTVISNMDAGSGNMIIKLLRPESVTNNSIPGTGDVSEKDELVAEGMYNKQSIKSIIPLSSTKGAQQPMINCGNIKAGTVFTWDVVSTPAPDLSGTMFFIITGKIARNYFSRSAKFLSSPLVYNYAEHSASQVMG